MSKDSIEIQVMRNMEIEKVIGSLNAILNATYDNEYFKSVLNPNISKAIELIKDCK